MKNKAFSRELLLKEVVLAMLVAVGVVISPILRVEGMCPMAHLINIVCAVLLGPWWSLLCALTGAVFGAVLSGVSYRLSNGKILAACIGEVIGTGIIGAIVSYPVMMLLWNGTGAYNHLTLFFYVPSFIGGTLIGGTVAFLLLGALSRCGQLAQIQKKLGAKVYDHRTAAANTAGRPVA